MTGAGLRAQVEEMERWRKEAPAHFITGIPSCTDAELKAFMEHHKLELPKRTGKTGRNLKADRVALILEFDRDQRLEAEAARTAAKKAPKVETVEVEEGEKDGSSSGDSDSGSSNDGDSDSSESEQSSSSEEEPPTPPPRKTRTKQTKGGKLEPTKRRTKRVAAPKEEKPRKEAKPTQPAKARKVVKVVMVEAPKARKTRKPATPSSSEEEETDEDQDGDSGTETSYDSDASDMPQPSAELKLLLAEIASGNSSGLVRRKLRDLRLKKQLKTHLHGMHTKGKLTKAELRNIVEDFSL